MLETIHLPDGSAGASGIAYDRNNRGFYVTNELDGVVNIIDSSNLPKLIGAIKVGTVAYGISNDQEFGEVYVTELNDSVSGIAVINSANQGLTIPTS